MNLNMTLFVQMINFFIAYLLFRIILFKPAVVIMDLKQDQENNLVTVIDATKLLITQKKQLYQQQWEALIEFYGRSKTRLLKNDTRVFKNITPELPQQMVSDELIKQLTDQTADLLVKKIDRICHDV